MPYWDGLIAKQTGRFVVGGIAVELLVKLGAARAGATSIEDCRPDLVERFHATVTVPNVEHFKVLADELMGELSDLSVRYHTSVCDAEVRGGRIASVTVANKDGLTRIEPRQVIDCTGDADVAAFAGVPVEKTTPLMPLTLHFRIGNVKPRPGLTDDARASLIKAHARGEFPLFYGPGLIFAFAPDEVYVHATRVAADASDAADLTRAEIQGRRDAWRMFQCWKREVSGFEDSYYIASGPYIGVRESRRIVGRHVLSAADLRACRRFDDAIATGCWYVDIHPQTATPGAAHVAGSRGFQPEPYDIPYRSLLACEVGNLLVAGRCHSATADAAGSTRVTITAMAMGEAAGTAAALAGAGLDVAALDGSKVREVLVARGAGPRG